MHKHTWVAFILSISAGMLVSCTKPNEANQTNASTQQTSAKQDTATVASQTNLKPATDKPVPTDKTESTYTQADAQAYLQHVVTDIIVPTYQEAMVQSQTLHKQAVNVCQSKSGVVSAEQLQQLREQWLKLALAWAKAEVVNFGPATHNMNNLYINYFPDERGLIHRSINQLIEDSPIISADEFVDQSAIVQGVPALEDLLYNAQHQSEQQSSKQKTSQTLNTAQCNYLVSASEELTRRLAFIVPEWQNNGQTLLNTNEPGLGLNQWSNSLLSYLETLKSTGFAQPLGLDKKAKGHLPAHVAEQSQAIIHAKLAMLKTSLTDPKLMALYTKQNTSQTDEMQVVINDIASVIDAAQQQLMQLPKDVESAEKMEQQALYDKLTKVTVLIKRQLMPLMGVQVGFNSTDGD